MDVSRAVFWGTKSLQFMKEEEEDHTSTHGPCSRDAVLGSPTSSWSPRELIFVLSSPYGKLYFTPGYEWLLSKKTHHWRRHMGLQSALCLHAAPLLGTCVHYCWSFYSCPLASFLKPTATGKSQAEVEKAALPPFQVPVSAIPPFVLG